MHGISRPPWTNGNLRYCNDANTAVITAPLSIRLGLAKLPSLDPFHDIDPFVEDTPLALNLDPVCLLDQEELNACRRVADTENKDDDEEDIWELQDEPIRNAFDMFDDEPDL